MGDCPPWKKSKKAGRVPIKINPGSGFGTGTHETTQLCLAAIPSLFSSLKGKKVLDFGSGSGILSIAARLLGGTVDAVEVDALACDNARENFLLNDVKSGIELHSGMPPVQSYDLILANILKPVLLQFADPIVLRAKEKGALVLSGLIESDIEEVSLRYCNLLKAFPRFSDNWETPEIFQKGEWFALVWRGNPNG